MGLSHTAAKDARRIRPGNDRVAAINSSPRKEQIAKVDLIAFVASPKHDSLRGEPDYLFAKAVYQLAAGDEDEAQDQLSRIKRFHPRYDPVQAGFFSKLRVETDLIEDPFSEVKMAIKQKYMPELTEVNSLFEVIGTQRS